MENTKTTILPREDEAHPHAIACAIWNECMSGTYDEMIDFILKVQKIIESRML